WLVGGTELARVDGTWDGLAHRFGEVAVVFRTHRAARAVARRLAASGLPYQVVGGDGPYGAPALRLVVAVLRVLGGQPAEAVAAETGLVAAELETLAQGLGDKRPSAAVVVLAQRLGLTTEDDRLAVAGLAG